LETEPGEPTIGQVHSDLFQQTTLAANAVDPPGAYGNVNINAGATITLTGGPPNSPAIYTMNSITVGGGSQVVIQGGAVVLNIAGINQQNPISFAGNSIQNLTGIPKNFVISYGGNNNISLSGGSRGNALINAPNPKNPLPSSSHFYGTRLWAPPTTTG